MILLWIKYQWFHNKLRKNFPNLIGLGLSFSQLQLHHSALIKSLGTLCCDKNLDNFCSQRLLIYWLRCQYDIKRRRWTASPSIHQQDGSNQVLTRQWKRNNPKEKILFQLLRQKIFLFFCLNWERKHHHTELCCPTNRFKMQDAVGEEQGSVLF